MDGVTGEVLSSGGVALSATACVQCMSYLGLDGELAAALAVLIAVGARMAFDYTVIRKREKNAE
tara:strand:- start:3266 stop:3457 length:192 start_codon:yes stop_codon:yes gene_type:complete